jgi:transketolase
MRNTFIEALCDVAAQDERVWLLTADLGYSVLEQFRDRFPRRYVNVGVAEQNMTGVAAGLARCGKIVFTYSIANFPTLRCLEQIRNDVCYHECSVKVVAVGAGFSYGSLGYTHHGVEDLAIMRSLPNMTVVSPGDPVETRLATAALAAQPGPAYLRLGKGKEPIVHANLTPEFTIGKAITVRHGNDLTLICTGGLLPQTLATADVLSSNGIRTRVLSMHTIKPIDETAILQAALETGRILTVEEHSVTGGLGSAVADVLAEKTVNHVFFKKFGIPDDIHHLVGTPEYLRQVAGNLYNTARTLFNRTSHRTAA